MTKPISTRVHGIIDYTWSAAASSLAGRLHGATSTARLLHRVATAATASALMTDYECGAVRLMPMKGHLALDAVACAALIASPAYLPASERRYALIPVLLGVAGIVTGLLTATDPRPQDEEEFGGLYGGGERSTADVDAELEPRLRHHLE